MPAYRDPFGDDSPGPYVTLRVSWRGAFREVLGLLDSAADLTQIPEWIAMALELEQVDEVGVTSAHAEEKMKAVYVADLEFEGITFTDVPVVGEPEYPIALIGRDLLNELNTLMEGPARQYTVVRP